jgi:hypothetical protein
VPVGVLGKPHFIGDDALRDKTDFSASLPVACKETLLPQADEGQAIVAQMMDTRGRPRFNVLLRFGYNS